MPEEGAGEVYALSVGFVLFLSPSLTPVSHAWNLFAPTRLAPAATAGVLLLQMALQGGILHSCMGQQFSCCSCLYYSTRKLFLSV